jgi:hypothetical protein
MAQVQQSGTPINLTSTNTISKVDCVLIGYHVNSTSSGTIVFRVGSTGSSSGTVVSGTITPSPGFNAFPMYAPGGCHATIGGTLDVTFFVAAG